MEIKEVTESQKTEYDNFVIQHSKGTFLQSWAWGEWQKNQQKTVYRYLFIIDDKIIGSVQAIFMKTFMGNYFYCPYGPLWDNTIDEKVAKQFFDALKQQLQKEKNIFFVRIEPVNVINNKDFGAVTAQSVQPPQTLIKKLDLSEDELLKSFHQKTRYNIRVALKHEVEIVKFDKPNDEVIDLIVQTSERQKYRNHSRQYIKSLWQFFSNNDFNFKVSGFLAQKNNTPLASGLMVDFGETRMYLFGGSNYEQRNLMAPYLMHWAAMQDAQKQNIKFYDFGASENASGHTGGYMRFKLGFNPEEINFTGTKDIPIQKGKYQIYKNLRRLNRLRLHI